MRPLLFTSAAALSLALCASAQERLGSYAETIGGLTSPTVVAFDPSGELFAVADPLRGEVHVRRLDSAAAALKSPQLQRYPITHNKRLPRGLAFDPDGRLWITDGVTRPLSSAAIGSSSLETYASNEVHELFHQPGAIAASAHTLAVVEPMLHQVLLINRPRHEGAATDFKLRASFGARGSSDGELLFPSDVAIAEDERVYVCDRGNHRIQVFSPAGEHLSTWGDWGWAPGFFADPFGVEVACDRVYVTDSSNHRVQVFDLEGEWLYEWGLHALIPREGEGKLHYPGGLAVSAAGDLAAVAEAMDDRVQLFKVGATPARFSRLDRSWQDLTASPHLGETLAVGGGLLFLGEPEGNRVKPYEWSRHGPRQVSELGGRGRAHGRLLGLTGMAYSRETRSLLSLDPGNSRVQLYRFGLVDPEVPAFSLSLGRFVKGLRLDEGVEGGALAMHPDGSFDLLDKSAREIRRYDSSWSLTETFGSSELVNPTDIEWDPTSERLLIVDANSRAGFDGAWGRVISFPGRGGEPRVLVEGLPSPAGLGVSLDGGFYVSDLLEHRVDRFDPRGDHIQSWGSKGLGRDELFQPRDVEVDEEGRVLVVDHGNHRLMVFSADGEFLEVFGPRLYTSEARGVTGGGE
jgi:DNA-binding beta-propeller fold protein YncE